MKDCPFADSFTCVRQERDRLIPACPREAGWIAIHPTTRLKEGDRMRRPGEQKTHAVPTEWLGLCQNDFVGGLVIFIRRNPSERDVEGGKGSTWKELGGL
jgi:hypothetical protein